MMANPRQTIFDWDEDGVKGRLEIDQSGRLYWNGERIAMETLRLISMAEDGGRGDGCLGLCRSCDFGPSIFLPVERVLRLIATRLQQDR